MSLADTFLFLVLCVDAALMCLTVVTLVWDQSTPSSVQQSFS